MEALVSSTLSDHDMEAGQEVPRSNRDAPTKKSKKKRTFVLASVLFFLG
jgi:hypothetical protein